MKLDHIVCVVPDLYQAMATIEKELSCTAQFGGEHPSLGTHNAIIGLGSPEDKQYLELLAFNPAINNHQCVLGLSETLMKPAITAWAVNCSNIFQIAKECARLGTLFDSGSVRSMTRNAPKNNLIYQWKIAYSNEQHKASSSVVPFLIDWGNGSHPTDNLSDVNYCHEFRFDLYHPNSTEILRQLSSLELVLQPNILFNNSKRAGLELYLSNHGEHLRLSR